MPSYLDELPGRGKEPSVENNEWIQARVEHEWQHQVAPYLEQSLKVLRCKLYDFHAKHKFTLLAHCQKTYRQLGPLLANLGESEQSADILVAQYFNQLILALETPAVRGDHINVLMHLQGMLKPYLTNWDKQQLTDCISAHHQGPLPLWVPVNLLKQYAQRYEVVYLAQQSYLSWYSKEPIRRSVLKTG